MHTQTHIYTDAHTYTHRYIQMHMHTNTQTHTHTHTHTHTFSLHNSMGFFTKSNQYTKHSSANPLNHAQLGKFRTEENAQVPNHG